jgi:hypothetical protein
LVGRVEDVLGLDADVGAEHARGCVHEMAHLRAQRKGGSNGVGGVRSKSE